MKNKQEYSVTEIAKNKNIEYWRAMRMLKKGCFPNAYKVGHGWVIPAGDINKIKNWKDSVKKLLGKGKKK